MNLFDSAMDIHILDTTLRDGSYANDFQFTAGQTRALCRELEKSGVPLIEVGHGVGLNAGNTGYRSARATDEEYMRAASEACEDALWGMFCIPGIASLDDVRLAGKYGMDFIRIGTNITEVKESREFVQVAKEEDMFVTSNYMKSYARSPDIFAEKAVQSESYGADMVYIVDSAGGMLPETVKDYLFAVKENTDIPVGFHGHDNLGLAVANSLIMADAGAFVIDTSLQGLGRSAGNSSTEKTVAVLEKKGYNTEIDFLKLLRTGQKFVSPIRSDPSQMPLDVVAGKEEFHSSHMSKIIHAAYEYDVDPAELIYEVCRKNKIYAPEELVEEFASNINASSGGRVQDYGPASYPGNEEDER
jgi:4-hydroxy-2-oxovalerate aldolase